MHDLGIRIAFDPAPNQIAEVNPETSEIRFGLPFTERLWAIGYAYLNLIRLWQRHDPGAMIDIPESSRLLLEWEFHAENSGVVAPLPATAPLPEPDEPPGTDGYAATELVLIVAAWVLLHEIGHLACVECHLQAVGYSLPPGAEFADPRDALLSAATRLSGPA